MQCELPQEVCPSHAQPLRDRSEALGRDPLLAEEGEKFISHEQTG